MLIKMFVKSFTIVKFYFYLMIGEIYGISYIINYLRNPDPKVTVRLLRVFGARIGDGTTIKRSIYLDNVFEDKDSRGNFSNLRIGNNCYIGDCVYFDLANEIIIGDNVVISGKTSFITHSDCNRSEFLRKIYPRKCEKIIIDEGVWIGFNTTVLCGTIIGKNSVIGANSLVNKNVEPYSLYYGVPACFQKSLKENE